MFPVGLIRPFGVASPIVSSKTGKVEGFIGLGQRQSAKESSRAFPGVDIAGFAVSLKLLHLVGGLLLQSGILKHLAPLDRWSLKVNGFK